MPDKTQVVLGLDGGGTKTHLALFTPEGQLVDFRHGGTLNHEMLPGGMAQLEQELARLIGGALAANGLGYEEIAWAVLGLAGVDTPIQHTAISEILRRLGLREFTLCNDAFLGIPAGNPEGWGVCAINGTGATLAGINQSGEMLQIGGIGAFSDDMGGASYLADRVTARVYRHLYRDGEETQLTPMLLARLGCGHKGEYAETVNHLPRAEVAGLNRLLFAAAAEGDAVALEELAGCAENYAGGIAVMARELGLTDTLPVVLAGSVFVKEQNPVLVEMLQQKVAQRLPGTALRFTLLDAPPVAGAITWALRQLGGDAHFDKVNRQLCDRTRG